MALDQSDIQYFDGKFDRVHQRIDDVQADVQKINGRLIRQEAGHEELSRRVNLVDEAFDNHVNEAGHYPACPNVQKHLNQNHSFKGVASLLGVISGALTSSGVILYCLWRVFGIALN